MNPDDNSSIVALSAEQCVDIEAALSGGMSTLDTLLASAPLRLHSMVEQQKIALREALDTLYEAKQPQHIDVD